MRKLSLFMLMAVGLLISGNVGAGNVCKIGSTEYASLNDAFKAITTADETTIEMIANVTETNQSAGYHYATLNDKYASETAINRNVVLDLAGKTISVEVDKGSNASCIYVCAGCSMTIKDSKTGGTLKIKETSPVQYGSHSYVILNSGILTIENGTYWNATELKSIDYVIDNINESANPKDVTCTINGGTFKCVGDDGKYYNPIIRLYDQSQKNVTCVINGGTFEGQRCFYTQKAPSSKTKDTEEYNHSIITLNVNNGIFIAHNYVANTADNRFIDSQRANGNTNTLSDVKITIGTEGGSTQPDITGVLYLVGGGTGSGTELGYDYNTWGVENVTINGGDFKTPNAIQIPTAKAEEIEAVYNYVKTLNSWKILGGQFKFNEEPFEFLVLSTPIQLGLSDTKGDYAIDLSGFMKYYGMSQAENWTDLGYILKDAGTQSKEGQWYWVSKMKEGSEDFGRFEPLIDKTKAGVKETVQGTVRNVQVIPVHGAGEPITDKQDWPTTDAGSQVVLQGSAEVTIPAGTTVEAYSVTVPTGTTLNVEKGATLIVGAGGVTTATGTEPISINIGSNDGSGAIKISPDAPADKAQPRVRIKLTTIAHKDAQGNSHWQYFARPTVIDPESFTVVDDKGADKHYIRGYVGATDSYVNIINPKTELENYEGYAITNNSTEGGVVYQFEGKLNANKNAEIKFKNKGFSLMGNSYLAPVSVKGLFNGIIEGATAPATAPVAYKAPMGDSGNNIEWTVWIYNCKNQRFEQINSLKAKTSQLQPMQGFFMKLREGTSQTAAIDYVGAVWNNDASAGPILAPAHNENGMGSAAIVVSANGCADQIDLFEDAEFDNSFNNGADASKLMNLQGMFNLYAQTEAGTLSCVASDNIEGTILTFQANNASEYELSFSDVENMNYSLIDLANGEIIEMNEGNVYKFNAVPNSTEARFQIVEGYKAPTAMEKVNNVKAAKGIYSVTGANLGDVKNFNALPAGIYIVNGQQIVK